MSRARWTVAVVLGVLAMVLHWMLTLPYSLGVSADSVNYLSAAQSLMRGEGLRGYDGKPLVDYAPLYPVAIALMIWVSSLEPLESARLVNMLIAGVCTGLMVALILRYVQNVLLCAVGIALLVFSEPLWGVYLQAWSEPLFVLESVLLLMAGVSYVSAPTPLRLLAFSVLGALCILTRYAGLFVVPLGVLILLTAHTLAWRQRLFVSFIYLAVSSAGIAGWLVRNYAVSGAVMGERAPSSVSVEANLRLAWLVAKGWFVSPEGASQRLLAFLLTVAVIALALLLLAFALKNMQSLLVVAKESSRASLEYSALLYSLCYVVWLVASASVTAIDRINNRLLSPVFVPSLLLVLLVAERSLRVLQRPKPLFLVLTATLGLAAVGSFAQTTQMWQAHRSEGSRYTSREWRHSPTLAFCRTMPADRSVFTNAPPLLYFATGIRAQLSPRWRYYRSSRTVPGALDAFRRSIRAAGGSVILVWLGEENRTFLYSLEQLQTLFSVTPVAELEDGGVYVVSERER